MKTFKVTKKIVALGEVVELGTIKASTVKEARKQAVAQYLHKVNMFTEQLVIKRV